jgi:SAM-dependent methyltransferase
MISSLKKILRPVKRVIVNALRVSESSFDLKIRTYVKNGRKPWSDGYNEYKWQEIKNVLHQDFFNTHALPANFGQGIDERIIEYPWIFNNITHDSACLLDAGSTLNFPEIINQPLLENKKITIFNYNPEYYCFHKKRISYIFDDLRDIPIKDNLFDIVICQSTLEHISMDNSIYGHFEKSQENEFSANYDYLIVVKELIRVLKPKGKLLITVPYGRYEYHGFFQQFDSNMIREAKNVFEKFGTHELSFFKYDKEGWSRSNQIDCDNCISFNPHTGSGDLNDGAAHSRSICCIEFVKR